MNLILYNINCTINNKEGGCTNIYTVSFFGHRELSDPFTVEDRLEQLLRQLIQTNEYVDFLVGRDGEFDQLVSSTIRRCKEKYGCGNVPRIKAAILTRNRCIIDRSDLVVCAVEHEYRDSYAAKRYGRIQEKS